jgi:hypothetical protein
MALNPPFTVRVEKPETLFADAMNEMRSWFDTIRSNPLSSRLLWRACPASSSPSGLGARKEATLFERAFA